LSGLGSASPLALIEPVAITIHFQDMDVPVTIATIGVVVLIILIVQSGKDAKRSMPSIVDAGGARLPNCPQL
jgi:hypothetical protein